MKPIARRATAKILGGASGRNHAASLYDAERKEETQRQRQQEQSH